MKTGNDRGVYSATKQQRKRIYGKIDPNLMDIRRTNNKLTTYWVSIPIYEVRGGTKVDLAHQSFDFEDWGDM